MSGDGIDPERHRLHHSARRADRAHGCGPDPPAPVDTKNDDDILWGDEGNEYGDIQSR